MFILRNKETKKFPCRYGGDKEFPLTTGSDLNNQLYGYLYGDKSALEKYFIPKEPDGYNDEINYYDPELYEIIEFNFPEPFYARETVGGRTFCFNGYGNIFFNTNIDNETIYTDEDHPLYDQKTGEALEVPAYRQYMILELFFGSVELHHSAPHEEGYSYETDIIELVYNDEGFPYWEINSENGGRDCDGPIERHNYYISLGGFNSKSVMMTHFSKDYSDEKYERELKWHSPRKSDPNKRGYVRDYYAEQAGY